DEVDVMDACFDAESGSGAAGADRAVGRGRGVEHRDRCSGGGVAADGGVLARAVLAQRGRRVVRRAAIGTAAVDRPRPGHHADAEAAAEETRRDALVLAAPGGTPRSREQHGRTSLEGVWGGAVAVGDVQVLYRPAAGREGDRRGRT